MLDRRAEIKYRIWKFKKTKINKNKSNKLYNRIIKNKAKEEVFTYKDFKMI